MPLIIKPEPVPPDWRCRKCGADVYRSSISLGLEAACRHNRCCQRCLALALSAPREGSK